MPAAGMLDLFICHQNPVDLLGSISLKNSSKPSHRLQQRRPILFVIIPVVAVGIGAFAAITVAQVVRNRLLEEAKLKEEAISTGSITGSEADKESKRQKDQ